MEAKVMKVTPEMAAKWLEKRHPNQRRLKEHQINSIVREIKAGSITVINQGIGFDADGHLIDGQQRLAAIVKAGIPVDMLVCTRIPVNVIANNGEVIPTITLIDKNSVRTTRDSLHMNYQVTDAKAKLAMANIIADVALGTHYIKLTVREAKGIIDLYEDEMSMVQVKRSKAGKLVPASVAGALAFAAKVDMEKADEFRRHYYLGIGLDERHPALALRYWMEATGSRLIQKNRSVSSGLGCMFNMALTAIDHYFNGKKRKIIKEDELVVKQFARKQRECIELIRELCGRG